MYFLKYINRATKVISFVVVTFRTYYLKYFLEIAMPQCLEF